MIFSSTKNNRGWLQFVAYGKEFFYTASILFYLQVTIASAETVELNFFLNFFKHLFISSLIHEATLFWSLLIFQHPFNYAHFHYLPDYLTTFPRKIYLAFTMCQTLNNTLYMPYLI